MRHPTGAAGCGRHRGGSAVGEIVPFRKREPADRAPCACCFSVDVRYVDGRLDGAIVREAGESPEDKRRIAEALIEIASWLMADAHEAEPGHEGNIVAAALLYGRGRVHTRAHSDCPFNWLRKQFEEAARQYREPEETS